MKKMHLLCNAHLDPAWLWRWNEGAAEAISTFRVAADFCERYEGFVFNHNEALLYEWVEEHEPQLFERIRRLVKKGNWVIMGGWYLQPDCVMTSGESLMEQIRLGREYFREKFGVTPKTAINFDPFGHTRGLVQILKNSGYDSYIFMRPYEIEGDFWWEGFDGSRVLAHGIYGGYNSPKGKAVEKIRKYIARDKQETALCLWGVGNHGGGPSAKDIEAINEYLKEAPVELLHSTAEGYMAEVNREALPVRAESLIPCMVGCYTSMVRVKQANRRLENKLAMTEKIMCYAELGTDLAFDKAELARAKKALAFCQFHDILPGSAIQPVEEDSLRTFGYGEEIADRLFTRAFFKLCAGQKKAKDKEIPILVFNPHPYEMEGEWEIGFMLEDQNWNEDEQTFAYVYDKDGRELSTQNEKPECTFNLDWIQKISFRGKLAPAGITRFDCRLKTVKKDAAVGGSKDAETQESICVKGRCEQGEVTVCISKKTGLIERFEIGGRVLVRDSGVLEVYRDNEDPWGMTVDSFTDYEGCFTLMSEEAANAFIGYPEEKIGSVRIVEDGAVRTKVQVFMEYRRSAAVIEYTIPKCSGYVDVNILLHSNEVNRMVKYKLGTELHGAVYGETAFGEERLFEDLRESVFHKWCGIRTQEQQLYVINQGIYGGSFTPDTIRLSLLRTPMYSAHPIGDRQIAPHDRYIRHMDLGERQFTFRITADADVTRKAQIYNEAPTLLSFFPSGEGACAGSAVTLDNPKVLLSSMKKGMEGYELTLYNSSEEAQEATLVLPGRKKKIKLSFGRFELKTVKL